MKRKVCVVVTARPSYSRIRTAMEAIRDHSELELQVVVAASALLERYGRVEAEIVSDGFVIDARVSMVLEADTRTAMAKTTGLGMLELATVFDNLNPDLVVTVADRFETLSTAAAAAYMGIPLAHVQGGEVTGSIDERVRHAVTKLADIHFPATEMAAQRIAKMGEDPNFIFTVGCPSIDLAQRVEVHDQLSFDPFEKYGGVGPRLDLDSGYIIVMQHPVTTEFEDARSQVNEVLKAVHDSGLNALWFWPNVDAGSDGTSGGIRTFREIFSDASIHFFKNVSPSNFIDLLAHSKAIVGNSSVAIREAEFLAVPAVNIGTRQEGRERGLNVVDAPYDATLILEAILKQVDGGKIPSGSLYGDGSAGRRIAEVLSTVRLKREKRLAY